MGCSRGDGRRPDRPCARAPNGLLDERIALHLSIASSRSNRPVTAMQSLYARLPQVLHNRVDAHQTQVEELTTTCLEGAMQHANWVKAATLLVAMVGLTIRPSCLPTDSSTWQRSA